MKVLVTGSLGMIGSATVRALLAEGFDVVGIDDLSANIPNSYMNQRMIYRDNTPVTLTRSIDDLNVLSLFFATWQPDVVVNLAAKAGVRSSVELPSAYARTNMLGLSNLLLCMRQHDIKHLVQASTSSLYAGNEAPFQESQAITNVLSPYAATKLGAEALCRSWCNCHDDVNITALRYFTVYGPHGRPDMLVDRLMNCVTGHPDVKGSTSAETVLPLYGDGTRSRAFTYVDDVARANVIAVKALQEGRLQKFSVFNVGSNHTDSVAGMINRVESISGKKIRVAVKKEQAADMRLTCGDFSLIKDVLGWEAEVSIDEGLQITYDAAVNLRSCQEAS